MSISSSNTLTPKALALKPKSRDDLLGRQGAPAKIHVGRFDVLGRDQLLNGVFAVGAGFLRGAHIGPPTIECGRQNAKCKSQRARRSVSSTRFVVAPIKARKRSSSVWTFAFCILTLAFFLRRLAALALVVFCVVTITFFMIRLAPGGPFDRERKVSASVERAERLKYKLEGPEGRAAGEALAARLGLGTAGRAPARRGGLHAPAIPRLPLGPIARRPAPFDQIPQPHRQRDHRPDPARFPSVGRAGFPDRHDRRRVAGGVRGGPAQRRVRRRGDVRRAAGHLRADVRDRAAGHP